MQKFINALPFPYNLFANTEVASTSPLQQNYGAKCIPVRDRGFLVQVGCHVLLIYETLWSMS